MLSTDAATITGPRTAAGAIPSSNYLVPANGAALWPGMLLRQMVRYMLASGRELRLGDFLPFPQPITRVTRDWAYNPAPRLAKPNDAPNRPVDKALEPITERGPRLHHAGQEGFR